MENIHDVILIIIIGAIILLQVIVFWSNYRKIRDYKKTIESTNDFHIVEVTVPEEWIKEIEVDEVLKNPEAFQQISSEFSSSITYATDENSPQKKQFEKKENNPSEEEEEFSDESEFEEVSLTYESEEEKIYEEEFEYEEFKNDDKSKS